jgi:hypothetical protein
VNSQDIKRGMTFYGWCGCGERHQYRVLAVNQLSGAVEAEVIDGKEDGRKLDLTAKQILEVNE